MGPQGDPAMQNEELIALKDVYKSFGRVEVLKGISLSVKRGEVVALVGDNGAGKSTLIKMITGVHRPTSGQVVIRGEEVELKSVQDSRRRGIETVYQERALADQQAIWRNVFAGREHKNLFGFMDVKKQRAEAEKLLRSRMGFTSRAITIDSEVSSLSGGEKQGVAIARALYFEADLIILDEPTMGLSLKETEKVLTFVRAIREQDKSVIIIDHNILHVYSVADR
ncbi:MAG: ATP-binding cassette domain-containing protein, partial [Rhodospirillales bacterium]|nr:ATP-binding cassette domain-containing protein [Rhodospirillales bacterium]